MGTVKIAGFSDLDQENERDGTTHARRRYVPYGRMSVDSGRRHRRTSSGVENDTDRPVAPRRIQPGYISQF